MSAPAQAACGLALAALLACGAARASGLERLGAFMSGTRSARADFVQKVTDRKGEHTQTSSGSLEFERPGQFRWAYDKPYAQLIVGDGTHIWIYDPDLAQVTVRALDRALGATPAALLAGNNQALDAFVLTEAGEADGLQWVLASPREPNGPFARIRMGFSESGIAAMELSDSFGQQTRLTFSALVRNPRLDPADFHFTPPAGTDVVGP
jgi:outer membrane lipoprotein carrier protein